MDCIALNNADVNSEVVSGAALRVVRKLLKRELLVPMTKPTLSKPVTHCPVEGAPAEKLVPTYFSGAKAYTVGSSLPSSQGLM